MESKSASTLKPLSVQEIIPLIDNTEVIFVDTRHADVFTEGYVPSSISIGLEGKLEDWSKIVLPSGKKILIIAEPDKEEESHKRLQDAGFKDFVGFLEGGFGAWLKEGREMDMIISIDADEMGMDLSFDENIVVLDVRKNNEYEAGHIDFAVNLPLDELTDPATVSSIEENDSLYIHCAGGYRSVIAASLLKRHGHTKLRNIKGGWKLMAQEPGLQQKIVYPKKSPKK